MWLLSTTWLAPDAHCSPPPTAILIEPVRSEMAHSQIATGKSFAFSRRVLTWCGMGSTHHPVHPPFSARGNSVSKSATPISRNVFNGFFDSRLLFMIGIKVNSHKEREPKLPEFHVPISSRFFSLNLISSSSFGSSHSRNVLRMLLRFLARNRWKRLCDLP